MKLILISISSLALIPNCLAQHCNKSIEVLKNESATTIESGDDEFKKIALSIWDCAGVGYKEIKSSALL